MIAVIRIRGQVGLDKPVNETFKRLKLLKKYTCIVIEKPSKQLMGMVERLRNFVAYGEISEEMYKKLVEARGKKNQKNFFNLHTPRGGIDSKIHFGKKKGVLGNNKEKINDLIGRML